MSDAEDLLSAIQRVSDKIVHDAHNPVIHPIIMHPDAIKRGIELGLIDEKNVIKWEDTHD